MFVFVADIMMARGIVRECMQDIDKLAAVAAASQSGTGSTSSTSMTSSSS